jgi:hypothetical protein
LALEGKQRDFKKGWAHELKNKEGAIIFNNDEADLIESISETTLKPMFTATTKQEGGGLALVPTGPSPMIDAMPQINPADISLDATFWKIKHFFEGIDKQAHTLSRELGPYKFFYDMEMDIQVPIPIPLPAPPFVTIIRVPVSPRAVPIIISGIVEVLRLVNTIGPTSNDTNRKILSFVLAITDLLQGDWKQAILSFAGFFGKAPLVAGLLSKVFLNALSLIAPDIQERLIFDIYQSSKSMLVGGVLWAFATFAPDFARKIVRAQFDKLKELANDANGQIKEVQDSMQKTVDPMGLKLKFNEIPDSFIPAFDDIQNLQAIARQPAIYCSKEFQEVVAPLREVPPIRLVLELMNIPTDPDTQDLECKTLKGASIDEAVEKALMPSVTLDENAGFLGQIAAAKAAAQGKLTEVTGVVERAKDAAEGAVEGVKGAVEGAKAAAEGAVEGAKGAVEGAAAGAKASAEHAVTGAKGAVHAAKASVKTLKKGGYKRYKTRRQRRSSQRLRLEPLRVHVAKR